MGKEKINSVLLSVWRRNGKIEQEEECNKNSLFILIQD